MSKCFINHLKGSSCPDINVPLTISTDRQMWINLTLEKWLYTVLFLLYNLGYVSIFFFCLTHLYIHHICSLQQSNLACYSTTASNLCSYSTKFKYLSIPLLEISFLVLYFTVVLILIRGIIKIHLLDLLSGVRKKKMLGTVLDNIKNCT